MLYENRVCFYLPVVCLLPSDGEATTSSIFSVGFNCEGVEQATKVAESVSFPSTCSPFCLSVKDKNYFRSV